MGAWRGSDRHVGAGVHGMTGCYIASLYAGRDFDRL